MKKRLPSIRKKISLYAIVGLTGLLLFFAVAVVVNGLWQRHQAMQTVEAEILATADSQAQRILGSLLLPEERGALPMILDQIKKQESLTAISLNQYGEHQVVSANSCKKVTKASSVCSNASDKQVRVLTRLEHSGRLFAELSKTKAVPAQSWMSLADPQLWILIFAAFTIGAMMLSVLKFIQRELCDSVQEIVQGLELDQKSRKALVQNQSFGELRHLARAIYGLQSQVEQKSLKESLGEMSRQVAHDMRSPLSLLKVVTAESSHPITSSEKRLAAQATRRLEQISSRLLNPEMEKAAEFSTRELASMIEGLIDEKSLHENGRVDFIFDNQIAQNIKLNSDSETVLRTLSNLLDNSIEATHGQARATVRITVSSDNNNDVVIDILDTGLGFVGSQIPEESSKSYGHGLGVKAARRDLTSQNGALAYNSLVGAGTATRVRLE